MKKLTEFQNFDFERFVENKTLIVKDIRPWNAYKDGQITSEELGVRVDLLVVRDDTEYRNSEDEHANFGETFTVKVENKFDLDLKFQDEVIIEDAVAVVYGQYQNQLSVTAQNVFRKKQSVKN